MPNTSLLSKAYPILSTIANGGENGMLVTLSVLC